MAAVQQTRSVEQEQRIVLHNISWTTYECLLADHESASAPRFTYDRGDLEIMSPRPEHEEVNRAIALLVEIVAEELEVESRNLGSTTFRRQDIERGFEPDSCFYIQNERIVRGKHSIDLRVDPPPDLIVEIDFTHSSIDKFAIFAALGVPEVWHYLDGRLTIRLLERGEYVPAPVSRALPGVTSDDVSELVSAVGSIGRIAWIRRVREWARGLPGE